MAFVMNDGRGQCTASLIFALMSIKCSGIKVGDSLAEACVSHTVTVIVEPVLRKVSARLVCWSMVLSHNAFDMSRSSLLL